MRTTQTTFHVMLCVYMFFSELLASIQPFVQQKMVTSLYSYFSYIYNLMLDFMYLHNRKKKQITIRNETHCGWNKFLAIQKHTDNIFFLKKKDRN